MPDNQNERLLTHDFPPAFPEGFTPDTVYFYQALDEHNEERVALGLLAQGYSQLSRPEQHDVILRANRIKLLAKSKVPAKVIPIRDVPPPQFLIPEAERWGPGFIGLLLLVTSALALVLWIAKM